jgi:hypothetical protein
MDTGLVITMGVMTDSALDGPVAVTIVRLKTGVGPYKGSLDVIVAAPAEGVKLGIINILRFVGCPGWEEGWLGPVYKMAGIAANVVIHIMRIILCVSLERHKQKQTSK